ncbi:hypothetical protein FI667_g397, partial [Globisporangium splendens]
MTAISAVDSIGPESMRRRCAHQMDLCLLIVVHACVGLSDTPSLSAFHTLKHAILEFSINPQSGGCGPSLPSQLPRRSWCSALILVWLREDPALWFQRIRYRALAVARARPTMLFWKPKRPTCGPNPVRRSHKCGFAASPPPASETLQGGDDTETYFSVSNDDLTAIAAMKLSSEATNVYAPAGILAFCC